MTSHPWLTMSECSPCHPWPVQVMLVGGDGCNDMPPPDTSLTKQIAVLLNAAIADIQRWEAAADREVQEYGRDSEYYLGQRAAYRNTTERLCKVLIAL